MKNFVKLIEQVHAQRYMKVLSEIITKKIPVAFLMLAGNSQAVETVKNFRTQGLNISTLFVADTPPPPSQPIDFNVVHISNAAEIYPQPEYIITFGDFEARLAIKKFPSSKVLSLNKGNTDEIYETFMTHLDELHEVYESLIDGESKKTFCGYWLGNISNRLGEFVFTNA